MTGAETPCRLDFTGPARRYARARLGRIAAARPAAAQERLLALLLARARDTAFGRAHGFGQIADIAGYQRAVPLRRYEDFWKDWWQPGFPDLVDVSWPGRIPFFAQSSGTTTGASKNISYTNAMRRAAARGMRDLLCHHLVLNPESRLFGGSALGLTGSGTLTRRGRARLGDVSAITAAATPRLLRPRLLPPPDLARLTDWREKIRRLAPLALTSDVRMLGGSPNWLLVFLQEVARAGGGARLTDWFPDLDLIVHGGLNFAPYRARFRALMAGGHAETREMYSASEGVFAYADRGDGEGMRLHLAGGIFFEFVPVEELDRPAPRRDWVGTARVGPDYALAISTAAGLWSYLVGDTVRLVSTDPPRLLVTGRLGQGLSAFGEHLIEAEIAGAVAAAGHETGLDILDYCVGVARAKVAGHHVCYAEAGGMPGPREATAFAAALDRHLASGNDDYRVLRAGGAVGAPEVRFAAPGGFAHWMAARRGLGGQNKVPRIVTDAELFADIAQVLDVHRQEGR